MNYNIKKIKYLNIYVYKVVKNLKVIKIKYYIVFL